MVTIILLSPQASNAQQDPIYSQYMFNLVHINPAYAGTRELLSTTAIYRGNFENPQIAPSTYLFTADWALPGKNIGLGINLYHDDLKVADNTALNVVYAYRIKLLRGVLSFGLQGGFLKYNLSSNLALYDYADPSFSNFRDDFTLNVGGGVFYHDDRFYIGASSPKLLGKSRVNLTETRKINEQVNHLFLTTGYVLNATSEIIVKPSALVAFVPGSPIHLDVNTNIWFRNIASIGASYRLRRAVVGLFEFQVSPQLRIGYSHDFVLNGPNIFNSSEILVRYEFGFTRPNIKSPRFF